MERKGKGRKKISMKKIENESHMQVTFSKRRVGLFKKASELCILCDAEVALIVFSPGNKVYSFGHPSVGMTINKFLAKFNPNENFFDLMLGAGNNISLEELNMRITNAEENLAAAKAKGKQLKALKKAREGRYWWDCHDKDNLVLEQLELLKVMMDRLNKNVQTEKQKISFEVNNYGRGDINISPTFIDPFNGMGYVHGQNTMPFDPRTLGQFNGYGIPNEYRLVNELDGDIPNLFAHNGPTFGGNHSSVVARANENNHIDVNNSLGARGTNTSYGSTHDYSNM